MTRLRWFPRPALKRNEPAGDNSLRVSLRNLGLGMKKEGNHPIHEVLPCGIEYAVTPLIHRHVVSFQIRVLSGVCSEPADRLGLARMLAETIDKGTDQRTGKEVADAFDLFGASYTISAGRETTTLACTVLPEHFDEAVALNAEILRTPTIPQDAFEANLQLTRQELLALDDDAQALTDKLISRRAFGTVLGRHVLGEPESIEKTTRDDLVRHWRSHFHAGRMVVAVAGAVDPVRVAEVLQKAFDGFGDSAPTGRKPYALEFSPGAVHYHKMLEQQQISLCFPGVEATHRDFPVQQVMIGVLAGGMSGRLFTEVREKQGLVYWVSAWQDTPRGAGMIFLGASTTAQRCDRTYATLLREIDRLTQDLEPEELERAKTGIIAQFETRGDTTRARCVELANDLLFFRKPVSVEEKVAKINAVTMNDMVRFLEDHPRQPRCVVTLGPRPLESVEISEALSVPPS